MKPFLALMAAIILIGCAAKIPEKPIYKTPLGDACAADCQRIYNDCMASEIRPDYLILSPRKKACENLIRDCYQRCAEKEK